MTYPRSRNGWTDNGQQLKNGGTKCPNCGSREFRETLSREYCPKCGLECDYWGSGSNKVYDDMMAAKWAAEEREREERFQRELDEDRYGRPEDEEDGY